MPVSSNIFLIGTISRGVTFGSLYYENNLNTSSGLKSVDAKAAWRLTSYRAGDAVSLLLPATQGWGFFHLLKKSRC